jgi:biopolymer transport protein ExbD
VNTGPDSVKDRTMNSQKASIARRTWNQARTFAAMAFIAATFAAIHSAAQTRQAGISIDLPLVSHATPVPDADKEGALIVAVNENGDTYLGIDPMTLNELVDKIKPILAFRSAKEIYIKVDARTPYGEVERVLSAVHKAGAKEAVLLTSQQESAQPGFVVMPQGISVSISREVRSGFQSPLLQLISSGLPSPTVVVNQQRTSWSNLQSALERLVQTPAEHVVQVSADGQLPFSEVVRAIDICRSTGASVVLVTAERDSERRE